VTIVLLAEFLLSLNRSFRRKRNYALALAQKKKSSKRLLVIGDPNNGGWSTVMGKEYDCGDICTDLVGCEKCLNSLQGDLLYVLKSFPDNSVVIFESCVLEYVLKLDEVKQEMKRVSNNDIFSTRIGPTLMYLWYFPSLWTKEQQIKNWLM
jgi:hypothetical protein